jgi:peptidoglycan/LPS O-acetylase OafA/YrhL
MPTTEDRETRPRGATAGFDLLRLALSLLILWSHAGWIQHVTPHGGVLAAPLEAHNVRSAFRALSAMAVPMFFALSGYLVTGSALRVRDPRVFLAHRLARILPALIVEVSLSAIALGAAFTDLPWRLYFTDPGFRAYFLNVLGLVHFHLPGVFARNPLPDIVNINLWTLPAEFYCYLAMLAAMIARVLERRALALSATCLIYLYLAVFRGEAIEENFPIRLLVWVFFAGACFQLYRDVVPLKVFLRRLPLRLPDRAEPGGGVSRPDRDEIRISPRRDRADARLRGSILARDRGARVAAEGASPSAPALANPARRPLL